MTDKERIERISLFMSVISLFTGLKAKERMKQYLHIKKMKKLKNKLNLI